MLKANKKSRTNIVLYFLITYITLLMIPAMAGVVLYFRALSIVKSEVMNANLRRLYAGRELLEKRLAEVESLVHQLRVDPQITSYKFISNPFTGNNIYTTLQVRDQLYDYGMSNTFIWRYYVFFRKSGIVLGPELTYPFEDFWRIHLSFPELAHPRADRIMIHGVHNKEYLPAMTAQTQTESRSVIPLIDSLGYSVENHANIVVLIDNLAVQGFLARTSIVENGWTYLEDTEGRLISSTVTESEFPIQVDIGDHEKETPFEYVIDNRRMLVTYTDLNKAGWRMVTVQPLRDVLLKVYEARNIGLGSIILSLIVGLGLAYRLSLHNSVPLTNLLEEIDEEKRSHPQIRFYDISHSVDQAVTQLITSRKHLLEELSVQRPLLIKMFYDRLLTGELMETEEVHRFIHRFEQSLDNPPYFCILFRITNTIGSDGLDEITETNMKRIVLKELLLEKTILTGSIHERSREDLVLIISHGGSPESVRAKWEPFIETIINDAFSRYGMRILVAVGRTYTSIMDVYRSYEESRIALSTLQLNPESRVAWYAVIDTVGYYFPPDVEARLLNLLRTGKTDQVRKLVDEIIDTNLRGSQIPILRVLILNLWGTLLKLKGQIQCDLEPIFKEAQVDYLFMRDDDDFEAKAKEIRDTFILVSEMIRANQVGSGQKIVAEMIKFIQSKYHDPNLGIPMLATHFGISEVYVSQLFKQYTGETGYHAIEDCRIRRAKELLLDGKKPIHQISQAVGYNSTNTFSKAFKRITGISAGGFRRNARFSTEV